MAVDVVLLDLRPGADEKQPESNQEEEHVEAEHAVLHAARDLRLPTCARHITHVLEMDE